ncbi:hypothetical protein BC834DRAFT_968546 [Gloeopeniophorella convolvens]|nr:hypothetical protein BC834DRAFT_968546 [Gloeopeniophorella convolvens]
MFTPALIVAALAAFASASPMKRQTATCPWNGVPNESNFTLLAVYDSDNSIRKPLALGMNGLPASTVVSWLGTTESIETVVGENFVMTDGGINAYAADGSLVGASDPVATQNGWLSFIHPDAGVTIPPAEVYCTLFNTSPHGAEFPYTLAVNGGDSDNFSVCNSSTSQMSVVVYNASEAGASNAGFTFSTCEPVAVHVLPVASQ